MQPCISSGVRSRMTETPDMPASARTAMRRYRVSAPAAWLHSQGLLVGNKLDYGCGLSIDNTLDPLGFNRWDPYWANDPRVFTERYDTILCTYVLNVIPDANERKEVLENIRGLLSPGGIAYITVRADAKELTGYTKRGTWQGVICLDLPVVNRTSRYVIYKLEGAHDRCS